MKASLFPIQRERRVQPFRKRLKVLLHIWPIFIWAVQIEYEELEQPFSFCKGSTCTRLIPKLLGSYWARKKTANGRSSSLSQFPSSFPPAQCSNRATSHFPHTHNKHAKKIAISSLQTTLNHGTWLQQPGGHVLGEEQQQQQQRQQQQQLGRVGGRNGRNSKQSK